jgi:hypothetical protein
MVLKIHWVEYNMRVSCGFFKKIFEIVENLQELHMGCKRDLFELSDEILEVIKTNGKNLKKLTTFSNKFENLQEKMKIFDENGVKCIVLDRKYKDLKKLSYYRKIIGEERKTAATCVWSS